MTSYRRYDTTRPFSKKSRYFYYNGEQKSEPHCCPNSVTEYDNKCSNKCNKCSKERSKNAQFDYYFNNNNNEATVQQDGNQYSFMDQESNEMIWVKESCNITVNSTDTQAGISLQAGLQLAISLVLNIAIGDTDQSETVSQELLQQFNTDQTNRQKIFIYNTKDATVTTTDTDLAINIQVLLQVLVALVVMVDIL